MKTVKLTLSNAIARRYFLHAHDECADGSRSCFFANGCGDDTWGFWANSDGKVHVDTASSNGELPSQQIVDACVRAAVKALR